jgi:uncharacterized protein (DUF608 family)
MISCLSHWVTSTLFEYRTYKSWDSSASSVFKATEYCGSHWKNLTACNKSAKSRNCVCTACPKLSTIVCILI